MKWADPCERVYSGAHDFEPLPAERNIYIRNKLIIAICRRCGVGR